MTVRRWLRVCSLHDVEPGRGVGALLEGEQVAIFLLPGVSGEPSSRLRAVDNRDPVSGANVLSRGLLGTAGDVDYVASPMHKHRFDLATGRCLDGISPAVRVWPVRVWGNTVEVLYSGAVSTPAVTRTHCPFCALQCGMRLRSADHSTETEPPVVEADPEFPVNSGRMCIKGWVAASMIRHPDRLHQPLIRDRAGHLAPASWDAALDVVARRVRRIQGSHGRDALGVFGSGALTNEKAYLLGKFARVVLRTPNIDYNGRYCMSSAAAALNRSLGIDRGLPFPLHDLADTAGLVLWGANPADTMPPLMQWVERMTEAGGTLAVVDPRRSATAEAAHLHVQPRPGTDLAVALGLLQLADHTGALDSPYISERTAGWDEVRQSVVAWKPDRVEAVSGVPERQLRDLFDVLAAGPSSMLLTGRGPEQQSKGVDTITALINLMLALGRVGRPASGFGCITGQANGQGGREHGQKADQLPGYRSVTDPADRAAVARIWEVDPSSLPGPGLSAVEMLDGIGTQGGIRGLMVFGSDLAVASPRAGQARSRLAELELLVVADTFLNDTAELAHVVLPVAQWAEEDGTTTNLEGRVLRRRGAAEPPRGVKTDIEVLGLLAQKLGEPGKLRYSSAEAVFDELRLATAGSRADYSGITYRRIDSEDGVYWPCPAGDHPGTPRLFSDRFAHPDGRARFVAVEYRPPAEGPDDDYPVILTTGRYREHYNSGAQTRRLDRLAEAKRAPRLQIHPELARRLGVTQGSSVAVESRRGAARFEADLSEDVREDTVFVPFHWGGAQSVNLLTNAALDPISRMPEFKVCAVRIAAASPIDG